jgi:SAM-dependent methyltransferase
MGTSYAERTSDIYGKYAFGNQFEEFFTPEAINTLAEKQILRDLRTSGITQPELSDMVVMDVGLGRQAVAFASLGVKQVDHFDISTHNFRRFSNYLAQRNLPILSTNADLCLYSLPRDKYDYVYLAGIVQHFSNPAVGLKNCASAVKPGGKLWLYFYRSGTFHWLITDMIRGLLRERYIDEFFFASTQIHGAGNPSNPITTSIMDDFYAPCIHLFPQQDYLAFMTACGFEVVGSANTEPPGQSVLKEGHLTCNYAMQRSTKNIVDISTIDTGDLLTPKRSVNQLDPNLHRGEEIQEILTLYQELKRITEKPSFEGKVGLFATCVALHGLDVGANYHIKMIPRSFDRLRLVLERGIECIDKSCG